MLPATCTLGTGILISASLFFVSSGVAGFSNAVVIQI